MKKEALFCDICGTHISSETNGIAFFQMANETNDGRLASRKIDKTLPGDVGICSICAPDVASILEHWIADAP